MVESSNQHIPIGIAWSFVFHSINPIPKISKINHFYTNPLTNSLMERRKPSRGSIDELASVKAAAWAWYQHGSGSEGRPIREYDLAMPKRAPKPSRYKIETAMKEYEETPLKQLSPPLSAPLSPLSSTSSKQSEFSLLDDYEIGRISKQLDHYIESSRAEYLRSFLGGDHRGHNKVVSFSESDTSERKSKQKNKNSRGFWFKYAAVCCSRQDDVVDGRSFIIAHIHGGRKSR